MRLEFNLLWSYIQQKEENPVSQLILAEKRNDIVLLTLNRPEKRNALSPKMVEQLDIKLNEITTDNSIRAVILTGAGKAFCAGADLAYLQKMSGFSDEENRQDSDELAALFNKIYAFPKLTVAMVNGPALAGGCGLALCCDYIFSDADAARFGFTEVRIGFVPAIVMNFLVRKVSLNIAQHLAMSGAIIRAQEAVDLGLAKESFAGTELRNNTFAFLENLLEQNSFQAMITTKKLFQQLLEIPLKDGLALASQTNALSRKSTDCQKGLQSFLNKEKIMWREAGDQ